MLWGNKRIKVLKRQVKKAKEKNRYLYNKINQLKLDNSKLQYIISSVPDHIYNNLEYEFGKAFLDECLNQEVSCQ